MLSRDEVRKKLTEWGISEPTEEQVSDYLAQIGKEVKSSEEKAQKYKDEALRVKELQRQLDEMNNEKLSDVEKANKATEDAMKQVAELQKTVKAMELSKSLAEIGIVGDDATQLVNEDGSLNTAKLGEILSTREKTAVASYQKKVLDETPSPSGGKPQEEDKDAEVQEIAKSYADRVKADTVAKDIVNSYV